MYFKTPCEHCTQTPKCNIMKKLRELADNSPYSEMTCMVEVDCEMLNQQQATIAGICSTGCTISQESKVVTNCKDECTFFKYCSLPIDFKVFNKFVLLAQDTYKLPVKLTTKCNCKLTGDKYCK